MTTTVGAAPITAVGEALIDLVLPSAVAERAFLPATLEATLGGAPFNVARTCGRLGAPAAFAGALSTDRFGRQLHAQLISDAVSTVAVREVAAPTTLAVAELDDRGSASYRFYTAGTSAVTAVDAATVASDLTPIGILVTGGLALVLEPLASSVEAVVAAHPGLVFVDLNLRPAAIDDERAVRDRIDRVVARADVVKVSEEDLHHLGCSGADLLSCGPRVVLVTAGAAGVELLHATGARSVPAVRVEVVDTIGAGDAFVGAWCSWWSESGRRVGDLDDLEALVAATSAGNQIAAITCTRRGADPPRRDELGSSWPGDPARSVRRDPSP